MTRLLLILALLVGSCSAQMLQAIVGGTPAAAAPSTQALVLPIPLGSVTSVNRYSQWQNGSPNATEASAQLGAPVSGSITRLDCSAVTAPSGGNNIISFMQGGSAVATCTIASGAHTGTTDLSATPVTLTEGDLIEGKTTTLTTSSSMSLNARVEGVALGVAVIPFGTLGNTIANLATSWFTLTVPNAASASRVAVPSLISGTLAALYVGTDVAAGGAQVFTFCDIANSATCVSTGILGTCTMSGKHTACTGLTGSVVAGHLIAAMVNNTSGSAANFGGYAKLTGVTTNVSIVALTTNAGRIAVSSTASYSLSGIDATEANASIPASVGGTVTGIAGTCSQTSASTGHGFTLNLNGSASAMTFLTGANAYGSDVVHTATMTKGQTFSFTTTNSNASSTVGCGGYVAVTGTT